MITHCAVIYIIVVVSTDGFEIVINRFVHCEFLVFTDTIGDYHFVCRKITKLKIKQKIPDV